MFHHSERSSNARASGQTTSIFLVYKQPPTSSYNIQLPHGRHGHHDRHGHGGHGGHGGRGEHDGQDRTDI